MSSERDSSSDVSETPSKASLDEETSPSSFDGYVDADETEISMQVSHDFILIRSMSEVVMLDYAHLCPIS